MSPSSINKHVFHFLLHKLKHKPILNFKWRDLFGGRVRRIVCTPAKQFRRIVCTPAKQFRRTVCTLAEPLKIPNFQNLSNPSRGKKAGILSIGPAVPQIMSDQQGSIWSLNSVLGVFCFGPHIVSQLIRSLPPQARGLRSYGPFRPSSCFPLKLPRVGQKHPLPTQDVCFLSSAGVHTVQRNCSAKQLLTFWSERSACAVHHAL
jgi:hypothetical protein